VGRFMSDGWVMGEGSQPVFAVLFSKAPPPHTLRAADLKGRGRKNVVAWLPLECPIVCFHAVPTLPCPAWSVWRAFSLLPSSLFLR
jgi:hypothetical protein